MEWKEKAYILWFDQITNDDVSLVGGKNASLGEMYQVLTQRGVRVPNGFAVTAHSFRHFVEATDLRGVLEEALSGLDTHDIKDLQRRGKKIRDAFVQVPLPDDLIADIRQAYKDLSASYQSDAVDVAVRSSATAEDLPGASFAGQQDTYLNIVGEEALIDAVRRAFASLFTDRAISYRVDKGFSHLDVALSVAVQKMVRSDMASSGVMFTLDTESGFRDVVQISSSWGLGEMVVQGKVTPDSFLVFKPARKNGFASIIKKTLGEKADKMIYGTGKKPTKVVKVPEKERHTFTLSDEEILMLSDWGMLIEDHYSERAGMSRPMDMEWAKDGVTNELFIVQARPETVQSEKQVNEVREFFLRDKEAQPLLTGIAVGRQIISGKARVILSTDKLDTFKEGEILVTELTDPDWEPIMKKASAIITEKGGRTSHAAIVSRELGIAAVISAPDALKKIKTGDELTVDCSSGVAGNIFRGKLEWDENVHNLEEIPNTKTHTCLNVGTPDGAFVHSFLPHHGVGLAREEFIFASHIRVHPLALLNYDSLADKKLKKEIDKITRGYPDKVEFFIQKLATGVAQIGAAFYPHQVIVRFSDFKTNEYATLLGGTNYEPEEENPMLGWRGASRYTDPDFSPAFSLECQAVKRVRETFGIDNVQVMVPFCRTPEEGHRVLEIMREAGLEKGNGGLLVYMMCEIPTNVIRANDFLDVFDGFSIGSNDLAQLTLGMDRDSGRIASISNENDPAVREMVRQAIVACKTRGKYIGFCGQAPSDYPDFTRFLVENGIDSISLNPDALIPMKMEISDAEKEIDENK